MAWIGALAVGVSLGLLGSGGSILTVPVLIFLMGEGEKVAIAESLAIVGAIALAGAVPYARRRLVDWRSVALFGGPGMLGSYLGAMAAGYVSGTTQLVLFGIVMLLAAVMMFRPPKVDLREIPRKPRAAWKIGADGLVVGVVTGLVGVGGGFLIVPALVILGGLEMHRAIGTSLVIIALKSFTGYLKYLDVLADLDLSVDVSLVLVFAAVGTAGTIVGNSLARRIPQAGLRKAFAAFLVVMGAFVLWQAA